MGGNRSRLRKLTLSFALAASLVLALPAFASAARVLYSSGHVIDAGRLAKFGGHTLVDPGGGRLPEEGFDGSSDSEWATALARTDFDVLVVGETAPGSSLSAGTLAAIGNYVASGRPIVVSGAHDNEDEFLNGVFGFSTVHNTSDSSESLTGTLQSSATGTLFAGGPSTLRSTDDTDILGSTPGTALYTSPEGTWVFRANYGAGTVTYLAWDLCGEADGGCGNESVNEDDWYRLLDNALQPSNAFTVDGITRNKKKGTATITVSLPNAGELSASGNGAKAAAAGLAVTSKSVGAGKAQLLVKAKGKKKKKLSRKGKAKLTLAITYTPTGGRANTQSVKVKLKKKLKKKK